MSIKSKTLSLCISVFKSLGVNVHAIRKLPELLLQIFSNFQDNAEGKQKYFLKELTINVSSRTLSKATRGSYVCLF